MKHTEKFLRQRKFALMLPVLVLPFLTLLFWTMGGGQGTPAQAQPANNAGLNPQLPHAHFGEREVWDKLSLYELAAADSARYREARESDPYFDLVTVATKDPTPDTGRSKLIETFKQKNRYTDPNEKRVTDKLEQLYSEINKSSTSAPNGQLATSNRQPTTDWQTTNAQTITNDHQFTSDVNRLEQMMELLHTSSEADPEMQQIESVLEKILDIQHPERVREKHKDQTQQPRLHAYAVEPHEFNTISSLSTATIVSPEADSLTTSATGSFHPPGANGFFGLDDEVAIQSEKQNGNAIQAIIHDTQELVAGATVRMRLLHDVTINGHVIQQDQFIYGTCNIVGERLTIEINSIRTGNVLLPVSLIAYDLDGLEGIFIPGAITRDAAKQAGDNALQNLQWMSLDPTLSQQAASAGIEAAKGLLSKKAKLIKVTVKAGYQILLVDKR